MKIKIVKTIVFFVAFLQEYLKILTEDSLQFCKKSTKNC